MSCTVTTDRTDEEAHAEPLIQERSDDIKGIE